MIEVVNSQLPKITAQKLKRYPITVQRFEIGIL